MHEKNLIVRLILLVFGLYLCGVGLTFFYFNGLGLDGWNVLHDGLSKVFNVKIGTAFISVSLMMLTLGILMKEKLGIATIANALLTGNFMQININLGLLKVQTNLFNGLMFTLIGMIITGFGYYFYMGVGLGSGPRDSFNLALSKRTGVKMGYAKSIVETIVVIIGMILGGSFGLATILGAIFTGIIVQGIFDLMKFNPKEIKHESLKDTFYSLMR